MKKKKITTPPKEPKQGTRFPGIPDEYLVKVTVGTIREGSSKITPTKFEIPGK